MNAKQANAIPIIDYLEAKGIKPEKSTKNYSMYKATYREDTTASLKVSHFENLWIDYGEDNHGGTLIDLALKFNPNFNVSEAIKDIHQSINFFFSFHQQNTIHINSKVGTPKEKFDNRKSTIETRHAKIKTQQSNLETRNAKSALPVSKRAMPNSNFETPNTKYEFGNSKYEIAKTYSHKKENLKRKTGTINSYYLKNIGSNPAIIGYLNQRGINLFTALPFCKEIYYQINGKTYFGLANKNNKGWSIRNKYWKGCTAQGYSIYQNGSQVLFVFEGIFDLLSFVKLNQKKKSMPDYLALNSLVNINMAIPELKRYQSINLYLDHDAAGRKATQNILQQFPNAIDGSNFYKPFKDLNEYHLNKENQ